MSVKTSASQLRLGRTGYIDGAWGEIFVFSILLLDKSPNPAIIMNVPAGVAHPVERHLAKVEVASSSLVTRSTSSRTAIVRDDFFSNCSHLADPERRCVRDFLCVCSMTAGIGAGMQSILAVSAGWGGVTAGSFVGTGKRPANWAGRWSIGCKSPAFRPPRSFHRAGWPCGRRRLRGRGSGGRRCLGRKGAGF